MTGDGKAGGNQFRASDNKLNRGIEFDRGPGGTMRHKITCVNMGAGSPWCKCTETIGGPANLPPDVAERKFRQKKWHHNRNGTWTCDPCIQEEKKVTTPKKSDDAGLVAPDPKLMRQIYAALDDAFDESVMRYRGNNTDESVAKAFDLSPAFISKVRREAYGELAEDPMLSRARAELREAVSRLNTAETKLLDRAVELLVEPRRLIAEATAKIEKLELQGRSK